MPCRRRSPTLLTRSSRTALPVRPRRRHVRESRRDAARRGVRLLPGVHRDDARVERSRGSPGDLGARRTSSTTPATTTTRSSGSSHECAGADPGRTYAAWRLSLGVSRPTRPTSGTPSSTPAGGSCTSTPGRSRTRPASWRPAQAAFDFPDWFGRNLDALADSLSDVPWPPTAKACVVLWDGWSPLARHDRRVFDVVVDIFAGAGRVRARRPFAVLVRGPGPDDSGLRRGLSSLGAVGRPVGAAIRSADRASSSAIGACSNAVSARRGELVDHGLDRAQRTAFTQHFLDRRDALGADPRLTEVRRRGPCAALGSPSGTPGPSASVRLPSRMSSPLGLPVTFDSPKTPRMSSRNWKASPSGMPYAESARISGRSPLASAAPNCSGRSTVYFAAL